MRGRNRNASIVSSRRFSLSEFNGAVAEEVSHTSSHSDSNSGGELNIEAIYDAIKPITGGKEANDEIEKKENLNDSLEHLNFDSTKVHRASAPDISHRRNGVNIMKFRRASQCSTGYSATTAPTSSKESSHYSPSTNIWTRLLRGNHDDLWDKGDVYNDEDEDMELEQEKCFVLKTCSRTWYYETRHFFSTLGRHPYIIIISFLVGVLVLVVGIAAIQSEKGRHIQKAKGTAEFVARDTGTWFADEFRRAMMPLYGIQQGVIHSGYFDGLSDEIGPYPHGVIEETDGTMMVKRNVTGICDVPDLQEKFRSIVEPVNSDNNLDGIVVSYRLWPNNVACLSEPNGVSTRHFNVEDFPQGEEKGSAESALGMDAANSVNPFWNMVIEELFITKKLSIFGPFDLPPLKTAMCGHLAIWRDFDPEDPFSNVQDIDGTEVVGAWGFIMNFLDWGKLLDRSDIYEKFSSCDFEFELTRKDGATMEGVDSGVLARSANADLLNDANSILVETESLHGIWVNRVGTLNGWEPSWYRAAVAVVVLLSLLFAFLTASMLVERQLHRDLLYKVMPQRAIQKLQRGQTVLEKYNLVTIFFSDIVGFTNMAGQMRPVQVMKLLNELYTEFDKLVAKHKVYKVETIGDAFMVVGGAPERVPAPLAAERVALFALDAINFVKTFRSKDGDQILIRAGLASGPTVAGVVGTSMPRYCFFGDTVNFASRMESTSVKMKVQVAEITYRLLQDSPNMTFDLQKRRDGDTVGVEVKGRGHQITYWVKNAYKRGTATPVKTTEMYDIEAQPHSSDVNKQDNGFVASQGTLDEHSLASVNEDPTLFTFEEVYGALTAQDWAVLGRAESRVVEATEDREVMTSRFAALLEHHLLRVLKERNPEASLSLSEKVQLNKFVRDVVDTYNEPNFHRLSHAMHVTTSMNKLLSIAEIDGKATSPLDSFSLLFSAFLHDAGHTGMTNKMLQDGQHSLSKKYDSDVPIAERFAIEIACEILFRPEYDALRYAIMPDDLSKIKFSKALFQSILVTDIATPSRVNLCIQRYEASNNEGACTANLCPLAPHLSDVIALAFDGKTDVMEIYPVEFVITKEGLQQCVRREHLMLLSDVAHLLQCWENFVKWNFRLYKELHHNFTKGLCPDPSDGWSGGQIGFLEKYAIPLAKRSEVFFNKAFSENLINLGKTNLSLWKVHGSEASSIMAKGVQCNEAENEVLKKLYDLPKFNTGVTRQVEDWEDEA